MVTTTDRTQSTVKAPADDPDDIGGLAGSWDLSLAAARKSRATRDVYGQALRQFAAYLAEQGMPTNVRAVKREHVEAWMVYLMARWKPATAHNRYRSLHSFFGWAMDEGLVPTSPMERMKPPKMDRVAVPFPDAADILRVIAGTEADKSPMGRRDAALLRLLYDTGMRRAEAADLRVGDVDIRRGIARVVRGKGGKARQVVFSPETAKALDSYINRGRRQLPGYGETDALWLGHRGAGDIGLIRHVVEGRSKAVGVALHPHLLRHAWASRALRAGMPMPSLQSLGGWDDMTMPRRYAAHDEAERAVLDAKRLMFGEDPSDARR
jgi:site-specific recombinase XerD